MINTFFMKSRLLAEKILRKQQKGISQILLCTFVSTSTSIGPWFLLSVTSMQRGPDVYDNYPSPPSPLPTQTIAIKVDVDYRLHYRCLKFKIHVKSCIESLNQILYHIFLSLFTIWAFKTTLLPSYIKVYIFF